LGRIRYKGSETDKNAGVLTKPTLAFRLERLRSVQSRWQVELFFKWIKQHLRIKRFFRHLRKRRQESSLDRVATYVLVALVKKAAEFDLSLHATLQILA